MEHLRSRVKGKGIHFFVLVDDVLVVGDDEALTAVLRVADCSKPSLRLWACSGLQIRHGVLVSASSSWVC
eukprot:1686739-Prymnesium_polylepis.2